MYCPMLTWAVLVIAWGYGLARIANAAASRGRSQVGWTALAAVISVACMLLSSMLPIGLTGTDFDVAVPLLALLAPLAAMVLALVGIARLLERLPVKVRLSRVWPVSCRLNGSGQLEILPDAVRLIWQDRTQEIPRAELSSIRPDGECLRLAWSGGELVLLPMLPPQTRDGRIEQSQTLARLLNSGLPAAIQVSRARP